MTSANVNYESCFEALKGTPTKSRASKGTPSKAGRGLDRFIPNRSATDHNAFTLTPSRHNAENADQQQCSTPAAEEYNKELARTLNADSAKVLSFKNKAPKPAEDHQNSLRVLYTQNRESGLKQKVTTRVIPSAPERILDAPELLDDYYLNLLDWSSSNHLGVALGDSVYVWNGSDGSITNLMQTQGEDTHITSLSWIQQGSYMAIGTSDHKVQIWDVEKQKQVCSMGGHRARIGALAWNGPVLSSGSRDSTIIHHDVRVPEHKVGELRGHTQEVCGLKWSPSGNMLASGGNDNLLNIWDDRYTGQSGSGTSAASGANINDTPLHRLDAHQAAVKALAWCPWQKSLLASGGGTADCMVRFWNTGNGACLNAVESQSQVRRPPSAQSWPCPPAPFAHPVADHLSPYLLSRFHRTCLRRRAHGARSIALQVSALQWSQHDKELVSAHGYSHNQLILWKYPSMVKVAQLTGHTSRILHMAQSPDGQTVVTASADETVRFWKILSGGDASKRERAAAADSVLNSRAIR